MKKTKRESRKKLKGKIDLAKPITLEMLGSSEDPCFGKHYDPRTKECQRCGDSELCAIALGQLNHLTRAKVEKENKFKDIEEASIVNKESKKELRKKIKSRLVELVKDNKDGVKTEFVILDLYGTFSQHGFKKSRIEKIVDIIISKHPYIIKNKNQLTWQKM